MSVEETQDEVFRAAQAAYQQGDPVRAAALCAEILAVRPNYAGASYLLGMLALNNGDAILAVKHLSAAFRNSPQSINYGNSLAAACYKSGDIQRAEQCLRRVMELAPEQLDARLKLAGLLREQGRVLDALREYGGVIQLDPNNLEAQFMSCSLQRQLGNYQLAFEGYQRLLILQPGNAEILNALGAVCHEGGELAAAVDYYRQAIALRPDYVEAHNNLGNVLQRLDRIDEAVSSYENALRYDSSHPAWQLRIISLCQSVPASVAESDRYRSNLLDQLNQSAADGFRATPEELVQTGAYPPYALMYHGRDDRPFREAYARLYKPCFPEQAELLPATGQRRIGFVVTKAHEAIFARSMAGVLRHMDAKMFELVVICMAGREQLLNEWLACPGVKIMPVQESITAIVQALGQMRFDILHFWEIATDPLNYFLPFYRLAPIQCTSWGIQVTSGMPTVDYYLSSSLVEPQDAARHYTERLLCSDTLLTYQYRSVLPETPRQRCDFGFGDDVNLYLFPQQIGKFHPDLDVPVAEILRRDPLGRLVILQDRWPHSSERLRARLMRSAPDVIERIVFLPRLSQADYLSLIAVADVLLDPPHYGGVNSSYDGFSLTTPILTCESEYHIGRYTAGCYRKMGLADCIPQNMDEYVDMAVELGTQSSSREEFSARLRVASPALFEDMHAVREHERLFNELLAGIDC
jgi:protein O-GlcNAc transferase